MKRYWVSVIIQDNENSKPWLCASCEPNSSIESAMKMIESYRKNYRVLSAWIDTFDENCNKSTVFHECYL